MTDATANTQLKRRQHLSQRPTPSTEHNARPEKDGTDANLDQRLRCALPLAGHLSEEAFARAAGLIQ